ncbi:MAG: glycosyltransferase family 4 protein [Deltaproteobacteria bacterium]
MTEKKIAYVTSSFPILTETFIIREIEEVKHKGIDIEIFSLKNVKQNKNIPGWGQELISNTHYLPFLFSVEILKAALFYITNKPLTIIKLISEIIRTHTKEPDMLFKTLAVFPKALSISLIVKDLKIKKIHAHWATIPTTVAWIVSKLNEIDFTFTAHAWDIFKYDTMLEDKIAEARKVITCTNFNKKYLEEKFADISPDKIVTIYHGMDLHQFKSDKKKANRIFTILSIGRLAEKKGFHILLQACNILKKKQIGFTCQIVYVSGEFEKEIFELYNYLELAGYVQFIPEMTQEKLIDYYNNADCFILPCIVTDSGDRDGIPNVILEALAMELPVVTTPISGIPEVIKDGETGLLVEPENAEELAAAIARVYSDPNLREKLGKAGRDFVNQHFEISSNVERLLKVIFS